MMSQHSYMLVANSPSYIMTTRLMNKPHLVCYDDENRTLKEEYNMGLDMFSVKTLMRAVRMK